jgi:hypothetical protein
MTTETISPHLPDLDYDDKEERGQNEKRLQFLKLLQIGTIQWDSDYDYKALRKQR